MGKNKKHMPFIHTSDKTTADELVKLGFQLIQTNESGWTFNNPSNMYFNSEAMFDTGKVVATDKLYM